MLDAVYDVTVAYPDKFPQTEPELILGCFPTEIHFHVRRHVTSTIPESETELCEWCQRCWAAKEKRLRRFYELKRFDDSESTELPTRWQRVLLQVFAVGFTMLLGCGVTFAIYWSSIIRWMMVLQALFYVTMDCSGGLELAQVKYYNYFCRRSKSSE